MRNMSYNSNPIRGFINQDEYINCNHQVKINNEGFSISLNNM